ncbi:hypothetical protein NM208_g11031 [Fusarium decemcellulare]|uniref:Uncharacterized protein n=1 Tax=Fusarium decemcellulare TaxID=57161 RepID=A0ACC1RVT3_9HYPO|nr:hypothetical protein NM208_g11031 [Fusarium decemcellulare]
MADMDQNADGFFETFVSMLPSSYGQELSMQPGTVENIASPFDTSTGNATHVAGIPLQAIETRLAHLLNSHLLLGISTADVTSIFAENGESSEYDYATNNITITTVIQEELVSCLWSILE